MALVFCGFAEAARALTVGLGVPGASDGTSEPLRKLKVVRQRPRSLDADATYCNTVTDAKKIQYFRVASTSTALRQFTDAKAIANSLLRSLRPINQPWLAQNLQAGAF